MAKAKAKTKSKAKKPVTRAKAKTKVKAKATTKRKVAAKKKVAVKKVTKKVAISKKQTKTQIIKAVAEETGLTNTQIKEVFSAIQNLAERHLIKRGSGEFTIPEMGVKIRRVRKKATKKRLGRNPFTGEEIMIPAKPARDTVRVTAMKALKEIIA